MREWLGCAFTRHDDAYLAEKLARAVEDLNFGSYTSRVAVRDALRDYRAQNPRER